jgi:hypothetical protein
MRHWRSDKGRIGGGVLYSGTAQKLEISNFSLTAFKWSVWQVGRTMKQQFLLLIGAVLVAAVIPAHAKVSQQTLDKSQN